MIGAIAKIFKLQSEYPPIHYSYIPPIGFPLPREYGEKIGDGVDGVYVEWIGLENLSGKVQKNIRIKLFNATDLDPLVEASRKIKPSEWSYDKEALEFKLDKLHPKENVYISLFHNEKGDTDTKRPMVIIGDQILSKLMEWHGFARKYKGHTAFLVITFALLVSISYWTFVQIQARPTFEDLSFIDSRLENFVSCSPYVVNPRKDSVDLENELRHSVWPMPAILQINEVSSESELHGLDRVLLCKKKQT